MIPRLRGRTLLRAALPALLLAAACGGPEDDGDAGGEGPGGRPGAGPDPSPAEDAGEAAGAVAVVDQQGRSLRLPEPPERLVSLVPSATDLLRELGAEDRLVGRTDFDTASALAELPSVGGGLEPDMERLVALEPDLVVRFDAESDPRTPARLDDAGVPHVAVRPDGVSDIEEMVLLLGTVAGRPERAHRLWEEIRADLDAVRTSAPEGQAPRVAFLLGDDPPMAAGPATFLDDLLEVAGARNVFDDLEQLYPPVSREELAAREIDRVLAVEDARLPDLPDGLEVVRVPGWVQQPGPRLAEAAAELARAVHREESGG